MRLKWLVWENTRVIRLKRVHNSSISRAHIKNVSGSLSPSPWSLKEPCNFTKDLAYEIWNSSSYQTALTTFVHKPSLFDIKFTGSFALSYIRGLFLSLYRYNSRTIISRVLGVVHDGSIVIWDSATVYRIPGSFFEVSFCPWYKREHQLTLAVYEAATEPFSSPWVKLECPYDPKNYTAMGLSSWHV